MADIAGRVLREDEAKELAVQYSPPEFPKRPSPAALEFVKIQVEHENPKFRINRVVASASGIETYENQSLSDRVETEALERLKQMQEEAYAQAYDLGREEGVERAYSEFSAAIIEKVKKLDETIVALEGLRIGLVKRNEAALIELVYQIAKKIILDEIERKPEVVAQVINLAVAESGAEQDITIQLAPTDLKFIEDAKDRYKEEWSLPKNTKFEAVEKILPGGCVVATNYGIIDASVEKRLERIWSTLNELRPKSES